MNYYSHHIGDFDSATRHLTRTERSVYRDLLDLYYSTEQRLTLDVAALCRRIIARTNEESTAVEQVLNEFFTKTATGWYHDRCEAVIEAYRANTSQKALAGQASAKAKRAKREQALNGGATPVEQPLTPVATAGNGDPTNHKPTTKNQEPKEEEANASVASKLPTFRVDSLIDAPSAASRRKPHQAKAKAAEVPMPDWLDRDLWDTWHSTPKRQHATPAQKQLAIAKLTQWRADGLDWRQALESAALAGWQGLFKPDPERAGNGRGAAPQRETFRERDERLARERFEEAAGRRPQSAQIIDITPGALSAPSLEYRS